MRTFRRHPAEVTSDRLLAALMKHHAQMNGRELVAISVARRALMRVAEEAEDAREVKSCATS